MRCALAARSGIGGVTLQSYGDVPSIEDFTITPRQAEVRAAKETTQRRQEVGTVARIIEAQVLDDSTALTLRPYGINKRAIEWARQTVAALEREQAGIEAEQRRWRRDD